MEDPNPLLWAQQRQARPVAMGVHKADVIAWPAVTRPQRLPADQGLGHRAGPAGGIPRRHPVARIRRRQGKRHRARILGPRGGNKGKGQQPGGQHVAQKSHHRPVSPRARRDAIHNLGKFAKPR